MAKPHGRGIRGPISKSSSAAPTIKSTFIATLLLLAPAYATGATRTSPRGMSDTLMVLTHQQVRKAGAAGTGCSRSLPGDRRTRFAAADDHAVIRVAKGIVSLRPTAGAHELFPFTYDSWKGEGIVLTVRPDGAASRKGGEAMEQSAAIEIRIGGHKAEPAWAPDLRIIGRLLEK